jgi:hypothetical protein
MQPIFPRLEANFQRPQSSSQTLGEVIVASYSSYFDHLCIFQRGTATCKTGFPVVHSYANFHIAF